ncbi:MAG: asparaginase [Bacteroidota bacterium]|jgi:beta-aspartyl-peptidase (threonine type)|nr:asparaginase [Bacteroidota bacterium]
MSKIAIAVHGGAGEDSEFIRKYKKEYEEGIERALEAGYKILKENGSAVDAVETAVKALEDNPLFNAGRGSALNADGEVEMCASIMDGKNLNSGAVAIVKNVKNPVSLSKAIMLNTNYRYLGAGGALDYAKKINIALKPDAYFITEHQYDSFAKKRKEEFLDSKEIALSEINKKYHGTVGAVALDREGNLAAATSTGGTSNCKVGRIGDSSVIGAGCYANNRACAVSATGDGEFIVKSVLASSIRCAMQYKKLNVQEACEFVVSDENGDEKGDIGVIALDPEGNVGIVFNCKRMHRGYRMEGRKPFVKIYE